MDMKQNNIIAENKDIIFSSTTQLAAAEVQNERKFRTEIIRGKL
jgi:hypothetical protein